MKKFLFVTAFLLLTNLLGAQVVVMHFNAGWNSTNDVSWIMDLKDCKTKGYVDIGKDKEAQKKYKIAVVPTIIIFKGGDRIRRYS